MRSVVGEKWEMRSEKGSRIRRNKRTKIVFCGRFRNELAKREMKNQRWV